jgi:hypothetical protein
MAADSNFMQGDPDRNAMQVPFSDDDTGKPANDNAAEAEDEEKPGEPPEQRRLRAQRRQERLNSRLKLAEEAVNRAKELEERDKRREMELAEMRGQLQALQHMRQQAQNDNASDPYQARLDAVYRRQKEAYNSAQAEIKAGTFDEKRSAHYEQVAREIDTERVTILTEKAIAEREPNRQREQAQSFWVNKYPEVYQNPRAYQYAEATFRQKLALEGGQPTNDMVDQVMEETMTRFKLGRRAAPSASERSRLSGVPSSGSGGGGRGDAGITMTPELKRIATAAHPDLSEAEAIKRWVNGPGKRLRDKKVL